jgi:hypothetical protein
MSRLTREQKVEQLFKFFAKDWQDCRWINAPSEWNMFLSQLDILHDVIMDSHNHINCKIIKTITCPSCDRKFCGCASRFVYVQKGVCNFCDELYQPFVANPTNLLNVEKYCPEKMLLLKQETCIGCLENQPNQLAHMDEGGCLYIEK